MLKVEILSVGTELLMGQIANTNAQYLSRKLPEIGLGVYYHSVVGDNPGRLRESLALALDRADVIITTGGLGPTQDDLTKDTIAGALGLSMTIHEESYQRIKDYFEKNGKILVESNYRQARFPEGSIVLENGLGTAPGCAIETKYNGLDKIIIMLPGPPRELIPMYEKCVIPYLQGKSHCHIQSKFLRIAGVSESRVEEMILEFVNGQTNPTLATYAKDGIVTIRISANDENGAKAADLIDADVEKFRNIFGSKLYTTENEEIEEAFVRVMKEKGLTFASAESCTGGLIAQRITSVSGASAVFTSAFVTYSNTAKEKMLNVPHETLETYGAVSRETALAMIQNAAKICGADVVVSVTGCAGPEGMEGKPVGLVYIGVKYKESEKVHELFFTGNRDKIRTLASTTALFLALEEIRKSEK